MQRGDDALIHAIYDVSLGGGGIPAVLDSLCGIVGAYGAMIFDCSHQAGGRQVGLLYHSTAYDPEILTDYVARYNSEELVDQDRLADLSSPGNEINLIHDKRLYSSAAPPGANVGAMERRGVTDRFGALLNKESWNTDRFAFQFVKGTPLPDAAQLARAEAVLAHLAKALSIGRVMAHTAWKEHAFTSFLDQLPIGLGIVGARGALIFGNEELRRIADSWPALTLTRDGRLVFEQGPAELASLMSDQGAHGRFGARPRREAVFLPGADPDNGLFIEVCPISEHPELERFGAGARLVSILDSSVGRSIDAEIVARFFPLSKSEVSVLGLLAQGHTSLEIAELRARSVETVNSQIKSLLRKTNSRNRTEMVKVATGLSAYGRGR